MSEDRKLILEMLLNRKISVTEADALLEALSAANHTESTQNFEILKNFKSMPKYLRIEVNSIEDGKNQKVNIKVPFQLMKAGVKLAAFIPKEAQSRVSTALEEKGINIDLNNIKPENLEELICQLGEFAIDIDGDNEKVKIYCE